MFRCKPPVFFAAILMCVVFSVKANALSFPEFIIVQLEKVGEFFSIASTGETTTGNVGLGCDCDQNIYDYCQGTTISVDAPTHTGALAEFAGGETSFTFSEVVKCGVFGNGHSPLVAPMTPNGTVTLVNTTPALVGSGSSLRNGFDVNPTGFDSNTLDGRLGGEAAREYPYTIDTSIDKITSIIKAHSRSDTDDCRGDSDETPLVRMCFEQLTALTILNDMPEGGPANYLRPPYYGTSNSKVLRPRSSVDLTRLPAIKAQHRGTANTLIPMTRDIDETLAYMPLMKLGWLRDYIGTERFKGSANFGNRGNGYAPNSLGALWNDAQFLYVDPADYNITQEQKNELAYMLVEHGLDAIQITLNYPRGDAPWVPNGGHGTGRYGFAAIAMALLNDGGALAAQFNSKINGSDLGEQSFAETGQITQGDNGYSIYGIRPVVGGKSSQPCEGAVNQLPRHEFGLVDNGRFNGVGGRCTTGAMGAYMQIASPIMIQQAIVCSMIPACKAIADQEWLSYSDRIMTTGAKTYAEEDRTLGIVDVPLFFYCEGGTNDGLIAVYTSDCPGGARTAPDADSITDFYQPSSSAWRDPTRNSHFGLLMYQHLRDCILTSTCEGQ